MHYKRDGSPDMRYNSSKAAAQIANANPSSSDVHIKKDGTHDMRYKSSKEAAQIANASLQAIRDSYSGNQADFEKLIQIINSNEKQLKDLNDVERVKQIWESVKASNLPKEVMADIRKKLSPLRDQDGHSIVRKNATTNPRQKLSSGHGIKEPQQDSITEFYNEDMFEEEDDVTQQNSFVQSLKKEFDDFIAHHSDKILHLYGGLRDEKVMARPLPQSLREAVHRDRILTIEALKMIGIADFLNDSHPTIKLTDEEREFFSDEKNVVTTFFKLIGCREASLDCEGMSEQLAQFLDSILEHIRRVIVNNDNEMLPLMKVMLLGRIFPSKADELEAFDTLRLSIETTRNMAMPRFAFETE